MAERLNLTRKQIAEIVGNDQVKIKQLEKLFVLSSKVEVISDSSESSPPASVFNDTSVSVDYIDFYEYGPHETKTRRMQWNHDDGTFDFGLYNDVVWQGGQELHFYVKNTSGVVIENGSSVMATGSIGSSGKITVAKAVSDGSVLSDYMIGIATQDIGINEFGYVTSYGKVRGIDTTGTPYGEVWADGDILYFNPTITGGLTKVQPSSPSLKSRVAFVVNASGGGSGEIYVRMKVGSRITELEDTTITLPLTGQKLRYNGNLWVNAYDPVKITSVSYTVLVSDSTVKATGSGITITLPSAVGYTGKEYTVTNAGNGLVTVIGTINGQLSMILPKGSTMQVYSDGSGYVIK